MLLRSHKYVTLRSDSYLTSTRVQFLRENRARGRSEPRQNLVGTLDCGLRDE